MREVLIFDTEYTAWEGSSQRNWTAPGEFREVIQIGAILADSETLEEIDSFSVLIRPVLNPTLSPYISALTGITQDDLSRSGVTLEEGVSLFLEFCANRTMYCYGYDGLIIANNLGLIGRRSIWPGLRPVNIGAWFEQQGIDVRSTNSGKLARVAGATFTGREHDALGDCRSILAAARILVSRGAPNPFV